MERIDFIICYNNSLYMEECCRYINSLKVPSEIEIGIIAKENAKSLASGYNCAMHESNAKYKVYLHQDVFILNNRFIEDVLSIFKRDKNIGMIGVLGRRERNHTAVYWNTWDTGRTYSAVPCTAIDYDLNSTYQINQVSAIDGMIMITQYDIEWREDVFDGFDFYDISQSEEMTKAGYKIVVPYQNKPWCMHDCGVSKFTNYDLYRKVFCDTYREYGYHFEEIEQQRIKYELGKTTARFYDIAKQYFENTQMEVWNTLMEKSEEMLSNNTNMQILYIIWRTIQNEKINNIADSIYQNGKQMEKYIEEYTERKFLVRRYEYRINDEADAKVVKSYIETDHERNYLEIITHFTSNDKETTWNRIVSTD